MTINDAVMSVGRPKSRLETGERMVDRLPGAGVLSSRLHRIRPGPVEIGNFG
jgi:hypothetical protein